MKKALAVMAATLLAFGLIGKPATADRGSVVEQPVVVAAGDSITWGGSPWARQRVPYPSELDRLCGNLCDVENVGHPGACLLYTGCSHPVRMREVLRREVWPLRPDTVIVSVGANDLGARLRTSALKREYRAIRADGAKHGVEVLLATITPGRNFWPEDCEAQRQELNDWIRTLPHVDFDAALANRVDEMRGRYDSGDGLHPSSTGYEHMAAAAWKVLRG